MSSTLELTREQARFADVHHAREHTLPAAPSLEGSVFMYDEHPTYTDRWLVARDGTSVDWARFRRSPVTS